MFSLFGGKKKDETKDGKDDKKDDEEKKEEEDAEGKEDEEEEEEEIEDAAVEDEDDFTLFPLEAQDWALKTLGDRSYAKYYSVAKNRSESDTLEMLTKRKWKVTLKNIRFTNQGNEHDVFIKFSFGHDLRVSRRFKRSKGQVEGGGGGGGPAGKGGKKPQRKFEWVVKGSAGKVCLTEVKKKVAKGQRADYDDEFQFTWVGSYFDLFKKKLHAEVWDWNLLSPNTYIASYESTLREICAAAMDQEWDIYTEVRKRGKVEKVNVGSLTFTLVFQEVLEYTVKLSNWNATLDVEAYLPLEEDKVQELVPFALFHLHSPIHSYGSSKRIVSKPIKHQIKGIVKWVKIDFGQLREMKFNGTRMDFESGELFVNIYDNTQNFLPTPVASKALAYAVIPLKAVMEVGVLSSYLTKSTKTSGTSIPALKVASAYVANTASSVGEAASKQFSAMTGSVKVPREHDAVVDPSGSALSVGIIQGNLDVEVLSPKLGLDAILNPTMLISRCLGYTPKQFNIFREFAQIGEPNPPELRDYPPFNQAYLCVRVIQARNLFPADETGTSDPYVVVRWGDQELKTRIVHTTLRPDFHEELYFLVRSNDPSNIRIEELARNPEIKITVYDYDPAGSSDMLGSTVVYLHQITGCGIVETMEEEEDEQLRRIPTRPVQSVTVRRRQGPGAPLRPVTIQTRVYRRELPLEGVLPDFKSTVSVECFFRTWEGDLRERNSRIRNKTHSDYIVLPPLKMLAKEKDTPCLCHSVYSFEKSAWESLNENPTEWELHRRMCASSRPLTKKQLEEVARKAVSDPMRGLCDTLRELEERLKASSLPSRSFLYKKELEQDPPGRKTVSEPRRIDDLKPDLRGGDERKERTIHEFLRRETLDCDFFLAKDFNGNRHWLPQFLHPLTPPKAMISDPEEAKYMVITSSKLPNAQFAAAQMVKAIDFWNMRDYHITTFASSTWIDPASLLTMKKGDMKAHALLLCNLFLGLQTDAYVCLGYARSEPSREDVLNLRERARESGWPSKKFEAELERMRGELQPCVWVMTRESSGESEYGESYRNAGSVKFWDVTHGTYYPPLPGRWRGQNDDEKLRLFKKPQSKSKQAKRSSRGPKGGGMGANEAVGKDSKGVSGVKGAGGFLEEKRSPTQPLLAELREEDLLEGFDATAEDGLGTDVGVGVSEVFELGVGTGDGWGREGSSADDPQTNGDRGDGADRRNGVEGHNLDSGEPSEAVSTAFKYERIKDDLTRTGWTQRFKRIMSRRQVTQEKKIRDVLPYTHLVAIFNHKNLWVNAQHYLDPTKLTFDLEEQDFGWIPVLPYRVADHTLPFYPPKTLTPKLTEDKVAELRSMIEDELEAGMTNARSAKSVSTKFAPLSMKKLLRRYVENIHQLEELDHSKKNGWVPPSRTQPFADFEPSSSGFIISYRLKRLKELIMNTVPPGFDFRIGVAFFHSIDPTDIRLQMLSHSWRSAPEDWVRETAEGRDRDPLRAQQEKKIHEENHDGREIFSAAAAVFPYYNQVCSVGVCVMVIYPRDS